MSRPAIDRAAGLHSRKRIALCVDDFGLHDGVNAAVFRLAELGRVNAVSCMVGGPAWRSAARALAAAGAASGGTIDLGLHLDLTELPLAPGSQRSLPRLLAAAYARRLDPVALRSEIVRQLDAFESGSARIPDYVDGHQHVHQLPVVRDVLLELLARRYPGRLPWLRSTRSAQSSWWSGLSSPFGAKARLIEALGARALRERALRRGHRLNARLLGVHDFSADAARYRALLRGWLAQAADGDLLMCHPAAAGTAPDALLPSRLSEFEVLGGDAFDALLQAAGVRLAPISRLVAA